MVTGADGFVGRHLLRYLVENTTDEIIAVTGPNGGFFRMDLDGPLIWDCVDITKKESVHRLIKDFRPNQVYHLAGIAVTSGVSVNTYHEINVVGTHNLAESLLAICGSESKFLFVSSAHVYGRHRSIMLPFSELHPLKPENEYGLSKANAEIALWPLWHRGLNLNIARPFNHTGPGQQKGFVCPDIVSKLKSVISERSHDCEIPKLKLRGLHSVRDFTDVRDVVRAYTLIMENFSSGEIVNVSSGIGISIREIVDILRDDVAKIDRIQIDQQSPASKQDILVGDSTLLRNRTSWCPEISLKQTLQQLWTESDY